MLDFVVVAQKIDKVSERRCSNGIFFQVKLSASCLFQVL